MRSGWAGTIGSTPRQVLAATSVDQLTRALASNKDDPFLAHGLGRSYGDSALNADGLLIDCRFLDNFLDFDPETGVLHCEPGVTVGQINELLSVTGWLLPVTPGTQFVTIGGAIANDVHGKNHMQQGSFGAHILALKLYRSDGRILTCSATDNADLFAATIGGLGLTGLILAATIQLRPIRSLSMRVNRIPFASLDELFVAASEQPDSWEYQTAWFDPGTGCQSGHYILANHEDQSSDLKWPTKHSLAFGWLARLPTSLPGRALMQAGNLWYRKGLAMGPGTESAASVLYPLDRLPGWNALFGKAGFYQHQCLLPEPVAQEASAELLGAIAKGSQAPTLAVGKWFGPRLSPGLLSFPAPGFSLALDFVNRGQVTERILDQLDQIVACYGGRVYPAKDARMSADFFASSYPQLEQFVGQVDPRFSSDFWRRMGQAK